MPLINQVDQLIEHERGSRTWYLVWFISAVVTGVGLILAYLVAGLEEKIGLGIGSGLALLFARPPLAEFLKRRDRLRALHLLKLEATGTTSGSDLEKRVRTILEGLLQKMLQG